MKQGVSLKEFFSKARQCTNSKCGESLQEKSAKVVDGRMTVQCSKCKHVRVLKKVAVNGSTNGKKKKVKS